MFQNGDMLIKNHSGIKMNILTSAQSKIAEIWMTPQNFK
jgi:hypothetical protein